MEAENTTDLVVEFWDSNQNNEENISLCQLEIDFFFSVYQDKTKSLILN